MAYPLYHISPQDARTLKNRDSIHILRLGGVKRLDNYTYLWYNVCRIKKGNNPKVKRKLRLFNLYIGHYSYSEEYWPKARRIGISEIPIWTKRVRAYSRREAIEKCLPEIQQELPKLDHSRKYVSVYCGEDRRHGGNTASRMTPIQVVIATGNLR